MGQVAKRNLNWVALSIPEDCNSIFVCTDADLFDERVKHGIVPLHDDRNRKENAVPCFIGYAPGSNLKHLDTLAGFPAAKQGEVPATGRSGHAGCESSNRETDNGKE